MAWQRTYLAEEQSYIPPILDTGYKLISTVMAPLKSAADRFYLHPLRPLSVDYWTVA